MTALRFFVGAVFLWLAVSFFTAAHGVTIESSRALVIAGAVFLVGAANLLLTGVRR